MRGVEHSIDDHDDDLGDQDEDHASGVLIGGELCRNIALIALHVRVEDEGVDCDDDLDRCNVDVQIDTWFLLLNIREQSLHKWVFPDEPLEHLEHAQSTFGLRPVPVEDIIL